MKILKCKLCNKQVFVSTGWYGTGRIFKFNCDCKTLEPFNGQGSYIEAFDYAKRNVEEWEYTES